MSDLQEIEAKFKQLAVELDALTTIATEISGMCRYYRGDMADTVRLELETDLLFTLRKWKKTKLPFVNGLLEDELAYVERYGPRKEEN